jgi:hypothetical protein
MFIVSKTIQVFELRLAVFESVMSILVLAANKIGVHLLFTNGGKLIMYKRNNCGPKMEPCGTLCLVSVQLECCNGVSYYILKLFDICL